MGQSIRILCTADLHVGRRPSRVGEWMNAAGASCAVMFRDIVEMAVRERVDIVVISGDLVDKENKYHEAYGPVERGLKRLASAGIDVFAVAGNHDFDVLPRLADAVGAERFHLLGRGGNWERKAFVRDGASLLHFVGWSFPAEHVPDNPLRSFGAMPAADAGNKAPVLGLLHADLDVPDSRYAPVSLRELQSAPVSGWLLGHVHKPRWIAQNGSAGILYPGSPQAMDPGETGAHGPWLLDIDAGGRIDARLIPMSRVRYDGIDIDLTGIESKEAFDAHLPRQLLQRLGESCQNCGPLQFACVRVRLIGTTPLHAHLKDACREIREQLELSVGQFTIRVEQIANETRPPVNLAQVAGGSSVAADLARLILQLQESTSTIVGGNADTDSLLSAAANEADAICTARAYQPLSTGSDPAARRSSAKATLIRQGMFLLETLLEQKASSRDVGESS